MKRIVKQVLGIDVAQNELVVSLGRMNEDLVIECKASRVFANTRKGFVDLVNWVKKLAEPSIPVRFVMEATGVYHEALAYYLTDQGIETSIVLPKKISNYFKTLEIKTITDRTASEAILRFGLERNLDVWKRPNPTFKKLRQVTRERDQLIGERTLVKNQLHAEMAESEPNTSSIKRLNKRLQLLNTQEKEINKEIQALSKSNDDIFNNLVSKHGIKMKAVVAVQRKILELIYTLHKTKKTFDSNYVVPLNMKSSSQN